jgi:biopolymer transport protein TolQ
MGLCLAIVAGLVLFGVATFAAAQTPQPPQTNNLRGLLGVDLLDLVRKADLVGKTSLCVLALFSVCSLTVIVYKWLHIRQAQKQTATFIELCNQGSGELEDAFRASTNFPDSPLAEILREAYMELEMENWYRGENYDLTPDARIEMAKISMERIFERTITSEIAHLESKLIFLATTSSVCPFIGLFGTVWGIMEAFQSLAVTGGTLASLGPGLATAMLTIIGGLVCAIPATAMFNYLTNTVRALAAQMDSFALELGNIIQKQLLKQSAGLGVGRPL